MSTFSDAMYEAAGATIVDSKAAWSADFVTKVCSKFLLDFSEGVRTINAFQTHLVQPLCFTFSTRPRTPSLILG